MQTPDSGELPVGLIQTRVPLHRSLATRSFLAVVAVMMLVMGGLLAATIARDFGDERETLTEQAESLAGFLSTVSPEAMFGRDFLTLETYVREVVQDDFAVHAVFIDTAGNPMTRSMNRGDGRIARLFEDGFDAPTSHSIADHLLLDDDAMREIREPVISEGVKLGEVRLLYSLAPATESATRSGVEALLITLGMTAAMLVVVITIFRRQVRQPLDELAGRTHALAAGDFQQEFDEHRNDEIGMLQRAFANMSDELSTTLEGLEEARDEAEAADRAKSQFLANMSHEIRTPLNALLGLTELLLDTSPTAEQREMLTTMHDSGDALLAILNEILDYSKLENGHFDIETEPFGPGDLLLSVVDLFGAAASQKNLDLTTELAPNVPAMVRGDKARIRQVLLNLVGNAVKFTAAGSVSVRVSGHDNDELKFTVTDTGIGIDESRANRLFEPFRQGDSTTTRRFGGTGLGLAISNRLVEAMGGSMSASGTPGVGSTFSFVLPLPATEVDLAASFEATLDSDVRDGSFGKGHPLRILLAEDNPVNQMVATRMCERLGYKIATADDGLEAVAKARESTYDLILMDISMPGLDGVQATEQIRAGAPDDACPRIVAFTAHALAGDREFYLNSGMDGYLTKPIRMEDLITVLRETNPLAIGEAADAIIDLGEEAIPMTTHPTASGGDPADPFDRQALIDTFGPEPDSMLDVLVPIFLGDAAEQLTGMRDGLDVSDVEATRAAAHSLKGAAASMALPNISAACLAVEEAVKANQWTEVVGLVDEVERQVDELAAFRQVAP